MGSRSFLCLDGQPVSATLGKPFRAAGAGTIVDLRDDRDSCQGPYIKLQVAERQRESRRVCHLLLDDFLPRFEASRRDSIWLSAAPVDAYAALKSVTAGEVRWFAPLLWLRFLPRRFLGKAEPLDLSVPIFEGFLRAGFIVLGERRNHECLIGGIGRFWSPSRNRPIDSLRTPEDFLACAEPGFTKAAFNFTVKPERSGNRLASEIRMSGTSPEATAWFRCYWFTIGWLSGLIRRSGLHAIRRRLERDGTAQPLSGAG